MVLQFRVRCSLRVFAFAVVVGVCILIPVNFLGNQLSEDFSDLPSKSLESFSIANVDDGSNRWVLGGYTTGGSKFSRVSILLKSLSEHLAES